jgi:transmembrane sensor
MNTPSDFEAQAAAWLVRREAPHFSAADQAEFEAWANADPRHRATFVRLEAAWRRADRLRGLKPLDGTVDEDLLSRSPFARLDEYSASAGTKDSRLEPAVPPSVAPADESPLEKSAIRRLAADAFSVPAEEEHSRRPRRWLVPLATAAVLAIIAIGAGLWMSKSSTDGWQRYATEYGVLTRIVLADGSIVHLNTNSVMLTRLSPNHREVVLERGEALFKVAHDASRPFDVQAAGTTVRAVGTEFSVRLREPTEKTTGQKDVEVLVKEGRVAIDPPKQQLEQAAALPPSVSMLSAGETVTISASRAAVQVSVQKVAETEVDKKLSWTEGRLWFERQRLADVVAEFNRYNRRQMVIADPAIADLRIGGGFEATDPESFVAALERTFGIRAFPEADDPDVIRLVGTRDPR